MKRVPCPVSHSIHRVFPVRARPLHKASRPVCTGLECQPPLVGREVAKEPLATTFYPASSRINIRPWRASETTSASATRRRPRSRSGAGRSVRRARSSSFSAMTREPASLRLPARARRRPSLLGGAEGCAARDRPAQPRRPRRGPPARLCRLRGRDPQGPVRGGDGRDLGFGHVRASRGEARRRSDRPPRRRAPAGSVDARPGPPLRRGEELAHSPKARRRRRRKRAGSAPSMRRCWPRSPRTCPPGRAGASRSSSTVTARSRTCAGARRGSSAGTGTTSRRASRTSRGRSSSAIKTPDCVLDGEVCALDEAGPLELLRDAAGKRGDRLLRVRRPRGRGHAGRRPPARGEARGARPPSRPPEPHRPPLGGFRRRARPEEGGGGAESRGHRRQEGGLTLRAGPPLAQLAEDQGARPPGVHRRRLHARERAGGRGRSARSSSPSAARTASSTSATSARASRRRRSTSSSRSSGRSSGRARRSASSRRCRRCAATTSSGSSQGSSARSSSPSGRTTAGCARPPTRASARTRRPRRCVASCRSRPRSGAASASSSSRISTRSSSRRAVSRRATCSPTTAMSRRRSSHI